MTYRSYKSIVANMGVVGRVQALLSSDSHLSETTMAMQCRPASVATSQAFVEFLNSIIKMNIQIILSLYRFPVS